MTGLPRLPEISRDKKNEEIKMNLETVTLQHWNAHGADTGGFPCFTTPIVSAL
jgi:hypothetical protein